jgi:hypothetical protein
MERIYLSKFTALLLLLVAVVAFLIGAYVRPFVALDSRQDRLANSVDSTSGRFSLVISPLVKAEKFLLDTQTGTIWQIVKSGDLPDKSFTSYRIAKMDDSDHIQTINDRRKLSLRIPNERIPKDRILKEKSLNEKMLKDKPLKEKILTEKLPDDKVTVEVITNGKISKERVPRSM